VSDLIWLYIEFCVGGKIYETYYSNFSCVPFGELHHYTFSKYAYCNFNEFPHSDNYANASISTATHTSTPTPIPSPSGRLIFTWFRGIDSDSPYWNTGYRDKFPNLRGDTNIFMSNWDGNDLAPITTDGLDGYSYVQDISPDGQKILVASFTSNVALNPVFGNLYVININDKESNKVVGHVTYPAGGINLSGIAKWINNTQIAYTGIYGGDNGIFSVNEDGTGISPITTEAKPYKIFAIDQEGGIYWMAMESSCYRESHLRWVSIDGTRQEIIGKDILRGDISMTSDGKFLAWGSNAPKLTSAISEISRPREINPPNYDEGAFSLFISPTNSTIIFSQRTFWDNNKYENPSNRFSIYVLYLADYSMKEILFPAYTDEGRLEKIDDVIWSPNGRYVLLYSFLMNSKGYGVSSPVRILDLETLNFVTDIAIHMQGKKSNFFWLPDP
jgi:hypothetical protein